MRILRFLLPAAVCAAAMAAPSRPLDLVPQPVSVKTATGSFRLTGKTSIRVTPDSPETRQVAEYLTNFLQTPTGYHLKVAAGARSRNAIVLALGPLNGGGPREDALTANPEAYRLEVSSRRVRIQASTAAGLFYGVQTLLQLFPKEIESHTQRLEAWTAPAVRIDDYPRFGWRGLMLDVSRHFFTKQQVEQYIDRMARYKFNTFHWHLTDDQGWRIEIHSRPKLTQVGAWRVPRLGRIGNLEPPQPGEATTYGGFYTQDDIREVIAFAKSRFITVVPEIEMPGHSLAALAAYPELSCTGGPFDVNGGWRFYRTVDNAYCPGNEETFHFLSDVLGEVSKLFPSQFVHIGGDEAFKGFWHDCPKCQRRMAEEHLKNEDELQSYLVRRAEKILAQNGKKLIGWDEILAGGLPDTAAVMSWRGMNGGITAAKMNHQVVMTPSTFAYLDLYQGDQTLEPDTYSMLRLSTSYSFNPVPADVNPAMILGGQGNLWTEAVPTLHHAEYMTWPRGMALSEVLWSPQEARAWDGFIPRMEGQFTRLDEAGVNYSRAVYDPAVKPVRNSAGKMALELSSELPNTEIYYTFDSTLPDKTTAKYSGQPVDVPAGATKLRAVVYRDGVRCGRMLTVTVPVLEGRLPRVRK